MPTVEEMAAELDRLYFLDPEMYLRKLNTLKQNGYKILRNSKCKHKVQINGFGGCFGDIFGDILNGSYK